MPLNTCCMHISATFPDSQFLAEQAEVRHPPRQPLACHYIKFYFNNVQPGTDLIRPVDCSAVFTYVYTAHTTSRLHEYEYATCTILDIFGVCFLDVTWAHGLWLSCSTEELVRLFIHAYRRDGRVIWLFVYVQYVFHTGYEFCVFLGQDTPVGVPVRLKLVFLTPCVFASRPMGILSSTHAFSSSSRMVQRKCPSGVGLQAIWMICVSARPSTLRRKSAELGLIL